MTRIKELRESKGLSQKQLAISLHVSQPSVSSWEAGNKVMSAKTTAKVADFFGVSIDYLLGREETKNKKQPTVVDDGLLAKTLSRVQSLSDPALQRVQDFLDGLEAGQAIGSAHAAAPDSAAGSDS